MAGWNGSGVFSKTHSWVQDKLNGIKVRADRHDANDVDFVNGINNCITRDGQNAATADLPMDGNKHTGVGNAGAADEYATLGQVVNNASKYYTTGGAADAYTLTPSPAITAYTAGQQFFAKISATNTTASTINVNALGVKSIVKDVSTALVAGDLEQDRVYSIIYDGTNFQVQPTGSLAWQNADAVDINGGTISDVDIASFSATTIDALTSAGIEFRTASETDILLLGAGNAANATLYGNLSMNTTNKVVNMADPTAAQDAATKAYVDKGTPDVMGYITYLSGTPTLQAGSKGISGITDAGAGLLTVTFSANFADTNYPFAIGVVRNSTDVDISALSDGTKAVGSLQISTYNAAGSAIDPKAISILCWRSQ